MTSTRWQIRDAGPDDVVAVAEFQTGCWKEAYRGIVPQAYLDTITVADRVDRWRRRIVGGERRVAIALSPGDAVLGVVSWNDHELNTLYVAAAHRGTGLATALLDHAVGNRPVRLWVFEENRRAIAFYARHGFRPDGQREPDPDTGVWMVRLARR